VGGSSSLTGVFANGTGVITPGNLAATSGTAVSVSPTTTTIYTLTVTPSSGTAVTQTVTVTVNAAVATISSFVASPGTITAGESSSLTGVFANGTGVITPGNLAATSGTAISVSPTTTTTYTLTVTPASGAAVTQTATVTLEGPTTITVNPSTLGGAVSDQLLGMNLASWYDVDANKTAIVSAFKAAGIQAVRWPGGSWSDVYHWTNNSGCGITPATGDTFTNFVNDLVTPGGLDVSLTADYGTDAACTGPGDPTEAAAWAAEALKLNANVSHITVGNEEYGSWETDMHAKPNDAATYANAVVSGYYPDIKAVSPNVLVGVEVNPGNSPAWDPIVLADAKYDFVEYHYYPETPGEESDTTLMQQDAQTLTKNINTIKTELATAGHANTPIYVGEIGGPYSNPGKQSWSITQGLYAGEVLGEMMNDGVTRLTWWIGFGNCNGTAGNDTSSVYGWQNFGAYNVFSDGPTDTGCPDAGPIGTMSPTARAFQLASGLLVNGEHVLTPTVVGDTTDVRAYAATNSGGTALLLFNLNENASEAITVTLTGLTTANSVTVESYDKSLYDQTQTDVWAAPTTQTLGAQTLPLSLTLAPWSMNLVVIH
jgi:hypothetical protein